MQDKELERSFPKPPRSFHGDILDPLLVEEDYEETVGIVRRFARVTPEFTEDDLLMRLARNGVKLYGTQGEWDDLFTEIREQIVDDAAKKKPPVEVTWAVRRIGDMATYTMVEATTELEVTPDVPISEAASAPTARSTVPRLEAEQSPVPSGAVRLILDSTTEGMIRPKT